MRYFVGTVAVVVVAAVLAISMGGVAPTPAQAAAEGWKVDPVHSFVILRIRHLNIGYVWGRFGEFSGSAKIDDANVAASSVTFEVKAASVDTGSKQRDDHLRGPDFFNAAQFPTITFQSKSVKAVDATHFDVVGDLTMHGTTKSVTVRMEKTGAGKGMMKEDRIGYEGTTKVNRIDFGVAGLPDAVGAEANLTFAMELTKG